MTHLLALMVVLLARVVLGDTLTYHFDSRGSTIALTDGNGIPKDYIEYSPYATTTYRTSTNDTPFLYNGRCGVQTDPNGLLHMRARYYNPHLCRFLNADPSGFSGGLNFYAYADGDPVSMLDPFGLGAVGAGISSSWLPQSYSPVVAAILSGPSMAQQMRYQNTVANLLNIGTLGLANEAAITFGGEDLYGNTVSGRERAAAGVSLAASFFPVGRIGSGATRLATGAAKTETMALQRFYPVNNGFVGATERTFLMPGQTIDRYGGSGYSRFFSPAGTAEAARALPPGTAGQSLRSFEVMKPFEVQSGSVAPWFNQPGGGLQYVTPVNLETLLKRGILNEVTP